MDHTLVSVLMAVYHVPSRNVLDEAIESIVNQTLSCWELIICNDGDHEETQKWLEAWKKREPRIRLLHSEHNQGAAAARNACLKIAQGEYIAVMDADDRCAPNRLEAQLHFLRQHPDCAFVGTVGRVFHRQPGDIKRHYWYVERPEPKDFLMTLPFVHASLLFRRGALGQGYATHWSVTRCEDYDLLMRLYAAGLWGANIREADYYIRENEGTFRRRRYRYRFCEAVTKLRGFSRMGLLPAGILFAIKPLLVGLIPHQMLEQMKSGYYHTSDDNDDA